MTSGWALDQEGASKSGGGSRVSGTRAVAGLVPLTGSRSVIARLNAPSYFGDGVDGLGSANYLARPRESLAGTGAVFTNLLVDR